MIRRWLLPCSILLAFAAISGFSQWQVRSTLEKEISKSLQTILRADVAAMTIWLEGEQAALNAAVREPGVSNAAQNVVQESRDVDTSVLADLSSQSILRTSIQPFLESQNAAAYFLTDRSGRIISSSVPKLLGESIPASYNQAWESVSLGNTSVMPPHRSPLWESLNSPKQQSSAPVDGGSKVLDLDQSLAEQSATEESLSEGVIIVTAPVVYTSDNSGETPVKIIGMLSTVLLPEDRFTQVLGVARSGLSGETYAVDARALLLSDSRFENQLLKAELLSPGQRAPLRINIHNPECDLVAGERPQLQRLAQPMTVSAAGIAVNANRLNRELVVQVKPYRDYRGVFVVGAWQWLPDYNFGIITEVESSEAFAADHQLRRIFWTLIGTLGLAAASLLIVIGVANRIGGRLRRAERKLERLGQYDLVEKIGAGGMGEVYRAKHAFLQRDTAVKLIRGSTNNEEAASRFEREVQFTSQLTNPHTVQIFDYGRSPDGTFFYAMEFLQGLTLSELVKHAGPLPDGRVQFILKQVCESLQEAHAAGLVHRDIKPSNIMLCKRGGQCDMVKVLDFGLVREVSGDTDTSITMDGRVAGTPAYMSPEAARGEKHISPSADLYALGCVGFYLLTGKPPFQGATPIETCWKQIREPEPDLLDQSTQPVTPTLRQLISKCLQKSPAARPATAEEILSDLEAMTCINPWGRSQAESWWLEYEQHRASQEIHFEDETEVLPYDITRPG